MRGTQLGVEELDFLDRLRSYLDEFGLDEVRQEQAKLAESDIGPAGREFLRRLGADGWLGLSWPEEIGGSGKSKLLQWLFMEELAYRRLPYPHATLMAVGPTIAALGTSRQREKFLPHLLAGEILCAIGYSEPEAGTDVAALRTRAVRTDEGSFVINGHKIYTTGAHYATHIWLAARTGPLAERHRSISIFMLPMSTEGIVVTPLYTQAGKRTNEVFFDDVVVEEDAMVGELNQGWKAMMLALDFERVQPCSPVMRDAYALRDVAASMRGTGPDGDGMRVLGESIADATAARLLTARAAVEHAEGDLPVSHASATKVWISDVRQRISSAALDLLGPSGIAAVPGSSRPKEWQTLYLNSPFMRFAAGTNEVQRDLIAQRGLGLPRSRQ